MNKIKIEKLVFGGQEIGGEWVLIWWFLFDALLGGSCI
jgi:hypothetical protein